MEQSNCPPQTIILLDKYFKKVNCRRVVKGFIVLMGYSKNRQIKRQARKSTLVNHEYLTCPQDKDVYTVQRVWSTPCSPRSMAREGETVWIRVREECIVIFRHTFYEKINRSICNQHLGPLLCPVITVG